MLLKFDLQSLKYAIIFLCFFILFNLINLQTPYFQMGVIKSLPLPAEASKNKKTPEITPDFKRHTYSYVRYKDGFVSRENLISKLFENSLTALPYCQTPSWRELMNPCKQFMKWENRLRKRELRTRAKLSRVELFISLEEAHPSTILIITYDRGGSKKTQGGDFWRVLLHGGRFRLSIQMIDHMNGSYAGSFVVPRSGNYSIFIHLEHSLCEGVTDQPEDWFRKGNIHGTNQPKDVLGHIDQFLNEAVPEIRFELKSVTPRHQNAPINFSYNKESCSSVINPNCGGYWENNQYKQIPQQDVVKDEASTGTPRVKINRLMNTLWVYGDSLGYRFFHSIQQHPLCRSLFKQCRLTYTWTYKHFNKDMKIEFENRTGADFNATKFLEDIKADMLHREMTNRKSVFLINFGLHLVGCLPMLKLFKLFQRFLKLVAEIRAKLKGQSSLVIWKTTTPPVVENTKIHNVSAMRFVTKQRVQIWNSYTISEACKANIPVLNVHEHPLASPYKPIDHVHFPNQVFKKAEDDFLQYLLQRFDRKRIRSNNGSDV